MTCDSKINLLTFIINRSQYVERRIPQDFNNKNIQNKILKIAEQLRK